MVQENAALKADKKRFDLRQKQRSSTQIESNISSAVEKEKSRDREPANNRREKMRLIEEQGNDVSLTSALKRKRDKRA